MTPSCLGHRSGFPPPSAFRGYKGTIVKHYPITGNCLIAFAPGMGTAWIDDPCLEVTG